jgi:hypothetical protein
MLQFNPKAQDIQAKPAACQSKRPDGFRRALVYIDA